MEQDPPPKASAAELTDKLDRANIDVLGGALHTIAHPIKYGVRNIALAAFTLPLAAFGSMANNVVRLRLAADRQKKMVDDLAKENRQPSPTETQ